MDEHHDTSDDAVDEEERRFLELRIGVDIHGAATMEELRAYANGTGRSDLIAEAALSAEEFAALVNRRGGSYPLEALRKGSAHSRSV